MRSFMPRVLAISLLWTGTFSATPALCQTIGLPAASSTASPFPPVSKSLGAMLQGALKADSPGAEFLRGSLQPSLAAIARLDLRRDWDSRALGSLARHLPPDFPSRLEMLVRSPRYDLTEAGIVATELAQAHEKGLAEAESFVLFRAGEVLDLAARGKLGAAELRKESALLEAFDLYGPEVELITAGVRRAAKSARADELIESSRRIAQELLGPGSAGSLPDGGGKADSRVLKGPRGFALRPAREAQWARLEACLDEREDFSKWDISKVLEHGERLRRAAEEATAAIRTRAQAESYLDILTSAFRRFGPDIGDHFRNLDLARPLARLRAELSAGEIRALLRKISEVSPGRAWQDQTPALKIALVPSEALRYIRDLPDDRLIGFVRDWEASRNLASAFLSLPERTKARGRERVRAMLTRVDSEAAQDKELPKLIARGPLVKKRNLELVYALLTLESLRGATEALPGRTDEAAVASRLNAYFRRNFPDPGTGRGGYDAGVIFAVARAIQRDLRDFLDEESYVVLFGSFPNGKASLSRSDVDVRLSGKMTDFYARIFGYGASGSLMGYWVRPFPPEYRPDSPHVRFQQALKRAEDAVAAALGREKFDPSELLSIVNPSPYAATISPIMVKITRDRLFLQVHDSFGVGVVREIEITP